VVKQESEKIIKKKIKKISRNLLTNGFPCGIIKTERGKENPTNRERKYINEKNSKGIETHHQKGS
jgi:hypothetical protein